MDKGYWLQCGFKLIPLENRSFAIVAVDLDHRGDRTNGVAFSNAQDFLKFVEDECAAFNAVTQDAKLEEIEGARQAEAILKARG